MADPERNRKRTAKAYGLTLNEYDALGVACHVCGTEQGRMNVDHDHATGRVRGLLCMNCNLALGHAQDDPARLRALASYLDRG